MLSREMNPWWQSFERYDSEGSRFWCYGCKISRAFVHAESSGSVLHGFWYIWHEKSIFLKLCESEP